MYMVQHSSPRPPTSSLSSSCAATSGAGAGAGGQRLEAVPGPDPHSIAHRWSCGGALVAQQQSPGSGRSWGIRQPPHRVMAAGSAGTHLQAGLAPGEGCSRQQRLTTLWVLSTLHCHASTLSSHSAAYYTAGQQCW